MSLGDLAGLTLAATDALFLDLDGTLAEIITNPDAVRLAPGTVADLDRLAGKLGGAVVIISGRDIRDLARRTPDTVWRAGGHGLEILAPGAVPLPPPAPPSPALLAPLRAAARHPGVRLEIKGPVAALHWRLAPEAAVACLAAAEAAAEQGPELVVQAGKMVVEVKPAAANKGRTLARMMTSQPLTGRRPLVLGDDATDEDAIAVAQEMGGLGVKVGPGPSAARLRAPGPSAVRQWLAREAAEG